MKFDSNNIVVVTIIRIIRKLVSKILVRFGSIENEIRLAKGIGYKPDISQEVKFLVEQKSQKNLTVLDIGANIGEYSIEVYRQSPSSKIYAFEPSKSAFKKLKTNVNFSPSIYPINLALGSENKIIKLFADFKGSKMASLYNRDLKNNGIKFSVHESAKMVTLDSWLEKQKIFPDLIKIDVEGAELEVLRGATKTLREVKAVQFEFGGTSLDAGTYFRDYWKFFEHLGYSLYRYSPSGLIEIKEYNLKDEVFEFMNYLAVRESRK